MDAPRAAQPRAKSMTELTALAARGVRRARRVDAMSGALRDGDSPDTLTLLGELALAAYDGERCGRVRAAALQTWTRRNLPRCGCWHAPTSCAAMPAGGRHRAPGEGARWNARRLRACGDSRLARSQRGAHQELEHLRTGGAPAAEIDRRLALLAFASGDLKEARQRFTELLSSGQGNDTAQRICRYCGA